MGWRPPLALSHPLDFKPSMDTANKVKDALSKQQAGETAEGMHLFGDACKREKEIKEPVLGVLAEHPTPPVRCATASSRSSAHRPCYEMQ